MTNQIDDDPFPPRTVSRRSAESEKIAEDLWRIRAQAFQHQVLVGLGYACPIHQRATYKENEELEALWQQVEKKLYDG